MLPVINSISALLQNLQESSQWELALKFVIGSFGTCLQHSVSSFMNASLSEKVLFREQICSVCKNINTKALLNKGIGSPHFPIWLCSEEMDYLPGLGNICWTSTKMYTWFYRKLSICCLFLLWPKLL